MISASAQFLAAQAADTNSLSALVYLILGNYANSTIYSSTATSSSDYSADYPASGAIDGDRTELNVGAASGAENDTGKSSWRSLGIPDHGDTVTLVIDMLSTRSINRIKLYHLSSHGLKTYKLSWSTNGSTYTDFAATSDIVIAGQTSITTIGELDTIDFTTISCRYVKITITHTQVANDYANIVELEIYNKVDVSDRVIGLKPNRRRDYKLNNPMATSLDVVFDNSDRFFSFQYTPTAAEVTSGFVNSELRPGLDILVKLGFNMGATFEYVSVFFGNVDSIVVDSGSRTAEIQARDYMKATINKITSSKLKTSIDIGDAVTYMLGLCNISKWEMDIDTASLSLTYFFTSNESVLTTIQNLTAAVGDGIFYFDENGIATWKDFLGTTAQEVFDTTQADFQAGTVLTNIDTTSQPGSILRQWFTLDNFSDGDITSNPAWTVGTVSSPSHSAYWSAYTPLSSIQYNPPDSSGLSGYASITSTVVVGSWDINFEFASPNGASVDFIDFFFMGQLFSDFGPIRNDIDNGYVVRIDRFNGFYRLQRDAAFVRTNLDSHASAIDTSQHHLRVTRDSTGAMNVYLDGTLILAANDTTYSTSNVLGIRCQSDYGGLQKFYIGPFYFSNAVIPTAAVTANSAPVFESQAHDLGTSLLSYSVLDVSSLVPAGCSLTFYTSSSSDGASWDAYVAIGSGTEILSTLKRYLKWKAVFSDPMSGGTHNLTTNYIYSVGIEYFIGSGSSKYPASSSATFQADDVLVALKSGITDDLGGDTSIINDVSVQASPYFLTGSDSDLQWQGLTGTPPAAVSALNPIVVTNGEVLTFRVILNSGMDVTNMSGANPSAASITAVGCTANWVFSRISPTDPTLVITITGNGTLTNLQVLGKQFASGQTVVAAVETDPASISLYGDRQLSIGSPWIISQATADTIALKIIDNFKDPISYIPQCTITPNWTIQSGDRVTLVDPQLGIDLDYLVIAVSHVYSSNKQNAQAQTELMLTKINT